MGPARLRDQRKRILYVGAGTVAIAALCLGALVLANKSTVSARVDFQEKLQVDPELAFGTVVLVAPKDDVGKGTKLSRVSLRKIYWPRDKVPDGAIREVEDIMEMYSKSVLPANQPILRSSLAATAPSGGISERLTEGHRAVTIEVDATAGVEGWAAAGAHVDILLTYVDALDGITKTRVVVEDAVVLSYDGKAEVNQATDNLVGRPKMTTSSTCTLMVVAEDALKIHTARSMGRISLALRNASDSRSLKKTEFKSADWRKKERISRTSPVSQGVSTNGFAKYTDSKGVERNLILKEDNQWWQANGNTDEDEG